jgi:glutamyl-tRNA(Gln) amidotransferase subunit D
MLNLIGATKIISEKKLSGVYVAMHSNMSNHQIVIHQGTSVRKNHTSRRDAFTSINREPIAYVEKNKISYTNIAEINSQKFNFSSQFDEKVHLLKFHPSSNPKILDFLVKQNYKGVIIEGTGLGHVSSNWYNSIKNAVNSGVIIGITSQCIAGRVSLNVYDTGRDLLSLGVIPLEDIVPETALTKLMWVLGNYKNIGEAKKIMLTNLAGEFSTRSISTIGKY